MIDIETNRIFRCDNSYDIYTFELYEIITQILNDDSQNFNVSFQ